MNNQLAQRPTQTAIQSYSESQLVELKKLLCKDLTDAELQLFGKVCQRTGLDPFSRQIYAIKRKSGDITVMTIQTGIDGYRAIAERSGLYDGQDAPMWCGADGVWREVWLDAEPPSAAKVTVHKKGCKPFVGIARWDSYAQFYNGKTSNLWAKMPDLMLAKCAEALALRKAFPNDLSGIYTSEEMEQADSEPAPKRQSIALPKASATLVEELYEAMTALANLTGQSAVTMRTALLTSLNFSRLSDLPEEKVKQAIDKANSRIEELKKNPPNNGGTTVKQTPPTPPPTNCTTAKPEPQQQYEENLDADPVDPSEWRRHDGHENIDPIKGKAKVGATLTEQLEKRGKTWQQACQYLRANGVPHIASGGPESLSGHAMGMLFAWLAGVPIQKCELVHA